MTALVRAELLKMRTVRLPLGLLIGAVGLVVLGVLATVLTAGMDGSPLALEDPELFTRAVSNASGGYVLVLVLGILVLTQEFRFGTATPTFLVTPRRGRVVVAKLLALTVAGLVFAAVSAVVAVVTSAVAVAARGQDVTFGGTEVEVLLGAVLVLVVYGPVGIGVAALVRNQIAAVIGALSWIFVAEALLIALLPDVGRWTPGGATNAVLQLGEDATTRGELLPAWAGAGLLVAYALAFSVIGTVLTLRRDLT
jgi:ABC-2 type transport system permease protein